MTPREAMHEILTLERMYALCRATMDATDITTYPETYRHLREAKQMILKKQLAISEEFKIHMGI